MSLVEVVVAAALMLIVSFGLLRTLDATTAQGAQNAARAEAVAVAREATERLRGLPDTTLASSTGIAAALAAPMGGAAAQDAGFVIDRTGRVFALAFETCGANIDGAGTSTSCTPEAVGHVQQVDVIVSWDRPRAGSFQLRSVRLVGATPAVQAVQGQGEAVDT
ncbi:MAG: hypothetical protein Q8O56_12805 [Solirubrobacteraceae bacterium]|nr:hypothetical protein [Solirubrobacteraceae bacterium]